MSDSDLKVTDRRMFTPDGQLREEYRHLERAEAAPRPESEAAAPAAPERPADPVPPPAAAPAEAPPEREAADTPRLEIPSSPGPGGVKATFYDLLASLVEPAALYLGDLPMADGSSHEDLELARVHIDLIEVLRDKTAGNLDSRELGVLEDSLYQLRMRHVQKRDG